MHERIIELLRKDPSAPTHGTVDEGLMHEGWQEICGQRRFIDRRTSAECSQLLSKLMKNIPKKKMLAAVKIHDTKRRLGFTWKEIRCLRSFSHQNIVEYLTHFHVRDKTGSHAVVLMEYANAGNIVAERHLFPNYRMFEVYSRYFILQICDALLREDPLAPSYGTIEIKYPGLMVL